MNYLHWPLMNRFMMRLWSELY